MISQAKKFSEYNKDEKEIFLLIEKVRENINLKNYETLFQYMVELKLKASSTNKPVYLDLEQQARSDLNKNTAQRKLEDVVTDLSNKTKKILQFAY